MTQETLTTKKKTKPNFAIHATVPNGRGTRIGASIGVAFKHKNGDGFSIYLDAQPIALDGQINLVAYPIET